MDIASRYLATVRLATLMPCSAKSCDSLLSLNGLRAGSALMSVFMCARMAVDEHSPPSLVLTWLEKKYLNSNESLFFEKVN